MVDFGVEGEQIFSDGPAEVKDEAFANTMLLNCWNRCCSRSSTIDQICYHRISALALTTYFFRRNLMETARIGKLPTTRCSQEVLATFRHQDLDCGFILDYKWPIPCRSKFMTMFQVFRISRYLASTAYIRSLTYKYGN